MPFVFKILENCFHSPGASVAVSVPPVSTPPKSPSKKWSTSVTGPDESPPTLATATFDRFCRGAMGIAGRPWRLETGVTPSVSFSIPARRQAFWPDGDLGSSNRPFPRRRPRSNGSARESSGSHVAGGGETPVQPYRLHPPEGRSGGLRGAQTLQG